MRRDEYVVATPLDGNTLPTKSRWWSCVSSRTNRPVATLKMPENLLIDWRVCQVRTEKRERALHKVAGLTQSRQSGITLARNTNITKRDSPYLRRALFIGASIAQRYDPALKTYYEKKRSEGKRYKEATVRTLVMFFREYMQYGNVALPTLSTPE